MFLHRILGPAVVLLALALLHPPQCAHAEVIFEDTLTELNKSTATYDAASRELHITGNEQFVITLAGYAPVLQMDLKLKLGAKSEIEIDSAESSQDATCKWTIETEKKSKEAVCTVRFDVDDESVIFKTKDDNNSAKCNGTDFARLQVDMHPNSEDITSDLQLSPRQQEPKRGVVDRLKKCAQLRPTQYPKQWIQNKQPPSSDVTTYVWHLTVQKTPGNNFIIRLPDSMTPVRLEPDPTTTATPTTAAALARSTTPETTSTTQSGAEVSGALSGLEIGLICGCSILSLIVMIGVIGGVSVYHCRKRARKGKLNKDIDIQAPNQDPSETETAVSMHVVINENLNEVYDGEPEVGEYVDRPNPKKKKKIGNRRRDHVIIEGRPKADHAIIERVAKKKGNMKADHVIIDMDDKPPSRN